MAWWIPVAMMAAGAAKGHLDQKAAKKKREAEAEIARWSPWTGMAAQRVDDGPGMLGGAIQGGLAGASMYQSMGGGSGGETSGGSETASAAAPSSTSQGTQAPYSLYGPQGSPQMAHMDYSMYEQAPIMQYRPNTWTAMK